MDKLLNGVITDKNFILKVKKMKAKMMMKNLMIINQLKDKNLRLIIDLKIELEKL